jgi:hypothetical protein
MKDLKRIKSFNEAQENLNIFDVISSKKLIKQNNKFYITDENEIIKGDKILYKIGKHKDYPNMFGECLGFDNSGFVMIHDDMSIHKSSCSKLIEIEFIETKISD